jgi:hypothetical protein
LWNESFSSAPQLKRDSLDGCAEDLSVTYELRLADTTLGSSELEHVDAGMGVAHGRFHPTAAYSLVQPVFRMFAEAEGMSSADSSNASLLARFYEARDALRLTIHGPRGLLKSSSLLVRDYSVEAGPDALELEVRVEDLSSL